MELELGPALILFGIGTSFIASLTWFYSSRPRAFIKTFASRWEWRCCARCVKESAMHRKQRLKAELQLGLGMLCILAGIGTWIAFR